MNEQKVSLHWVGTVLSLAGAFGAWVSTHIALISGGFAVAAAVFSIFASIADRRLKTDMRENPHRYGRRN